MGKRSLVLIAALCFVGVFAIHQMGHAGLFSWFRNERPRAAVEWPEWEGYRGAFVSGDGRVTDHSAPDLRTVSEGQAYGMFLSLVANDKPTFDRLLEWTTNNLAQGDLSKNLPAWIWGRQADNWQVIDSNSASDADLWIVFSLLEASRLWCEPKYEIIGKALGQLVLSDEVLQVTGLGHSLLPGRVGFVKEDGSTRLNPSYVPPFLMARLADSNPDNAAWSKLYLGSQSLLLNAHRNGLYPDWIDYRNGQAAIPLEDGDYDAIRVYLWIAMTPESDPVYQTMAEGIRPVLKTIVSRENAPDAWSLDNGTLSAAAGPAGFEWVFAAAAKRILGTERKVPPMPKANQTAWRNYGYYNGMLSLFSQGFLQGRYSFGAKGQLIRHGIKESPCG